MIEYKLGFSLTCGSLVDLGGSLAGRKVGSTYRLSEVGSDASTFGST